MATEMQIEARKYSEAERNEMIEQIAGEMAAGIVQYKNNPSEAILTELLQLVADFYDVQNPYSEEECVACGSTDVSEETPNGRPLCSACWHSEDNTRSNHRHMEAEQVRAEYAYDDGNDQ